MRDASTDDSGFLSPLVTEGRPLLTLGTLGLFFSGGFAIFLAAAGDFLPQDTRFLGMTARELCAQNACRIVHFMIHDRVSFGGVLIAISIIYLWIIHFPLREGQPWAWWTLLISNIAGFSSFLSYLSFGYLDTWHGMATLLLLPCFAAGLTLSYRRLQRPRGIASLLHPTDRSTPRMRAGFGRWLLLASGFGLAVAGLTISLVGMTIVFVPQDLEYMSATVARLNSLNPRLIPLIAHDRAGFGGGVLNLGILVMAIIGCGAPSRYRWQALFLAGVVGFGAAIGIHPIVGYNNPVHLAPACLAAICYFIALMLTRPHVSARPVQLQAQGFRA